MQEYQSYKGKYIGPGCYSSRAEVDEALKREAVENVQMLAELFMNHKNYATAVALADAQQRLVDHFGYTWEEAEAIEIEAYKESEQP